MFTNHRGSKLTKLEYGPWGEPLEGNYARARFGYTGHQFEAGTGHWGSLFRQYDSRAGRWTQRDPIGTAGGLNRYAYVGSNPARMVDPLGLCGRLPKDPERMPGESEDTYQARVDAFHRAFIEEVDREGFKAAGITLLGMLPVVGPYITAGVVTSDVSTLAGEIAGDPSVQNKEALLQYLVILLATIEAHRSINGGASSEPIRESTPEPRPDLKEKSTLRNPDGTVKNPVDQVNQIEAARKRGGLIEDTSKSKQNLKNKLKNYDPSDWED